MLPDPISTSYGFTQTPTGGTAYTLQKTNLGSYLATDGPFTLDQPCSFKVAPKIKLMGISSCVHTYEVSKNVPAVNGVAQPDDVMKIQVRYDANFRSFTATDIQNAINACAFLAWTYAPRTTRGEV